jgi:predicted tellurium resistance membrane protein TerC
MRISRVPHRPPSEGALRRFRRITALIALMVGVLLMLQYTAYAILPVRKTDTVWGILVGVVVMGLVISARWTAATRRLARDAATEQDEQQPV